jgi:uncharacterized protein DUF11/Big-like domain-containing protein
VTRLRAKLFFTSAVVLTVTVFVVSAGSQAIDQKRIDGPVFVDLGDLFKRAPIKIEDVDIAKLPGLPRGYAALNNKAYSITTEAVAAGPYTVRFNAGSITDEETFKNLRIFHTEPDAFDPESVVWVDRTARQPDAPDPNFRTRTIHAFSPEMYPGIYVIGRMVEKIPPSTAVTDLEVVAKGTPEQVQMPEHVTFDITVKNKGPDMATNVGAKMDQSHDGGYLVSVTPSQGTCKYQPSGVYCKLGQLAAGASLKIKFVLAPEQDFGERDYESEITVAATEQDSNVDNNKTTASVFVRADPNQPPKLTAFQGPTKNVIEAGSTVVFKATASDPDGLIEKVEFYDVMTREKLGRGTSLDGKQFLFSTNSLSNGQHVVFAVATDNGGRTDEEPLRIFVNGPIKVRIAEPKPETLIAPGSNLALIAEATNPSGSIKSIEFFANGMSLGEASAAEDNRFTLKLRDMHRVRYSIEAIAKDASGLISKSDTVDLIVSTIPTVKIATPSDGATLVTPVNFVLVLNAETPEYGRRVKVYANGALINEGSVIIPGEYTFPWSNPEPGKYTLTAVVIDAVGAKGESSPVNIVIANGKLKNQQE